MPIWTIKLRVNVPGLGERLVDITGISASTLEAASVAARAAVVIEPMQGIQTAP